MATGGGGFGQQGLFGSAAPTSQPSLFGSAAPASQPSLFGSAVPVSQSSLFGSAAPAPQASLFGSTAPAPQQNLFGSAAPTSQSALLGSTAPASQSSLFGAWSSATGTQQPLPIAQPAFQSSLFGSSAPGTSAFGTTGFGGIPQQPALQPQQVQQQQQQLQHMQQQNYMIQQQPQVLQQQTLGVIMPPRLNDLIQTLDPRSAGSPFHAALFNVVTSGDVERYQRPPGMLEKLYEDAMLNNPDPIGLVPIQANGFEDLLRRVELQDARMKQHASVLSAIETVVARIEDSITTDLDTKLALYRRSHRELARKLLKLACRVERRSCANDSDPSLTHGELDYKRRLDAIARNIAAPALFKDKLNDLVELAEATRAERSRLVASTYARDPKSTAVIRELLQEQLNGISHLGEICRRADRDIGILEEQLKL
jgi:nuclear pore complex protein Nup54